MPSEIAKSIQLRATEIRQLGIYIGLYEWLAWSALQRIDVEMLFGSHVVILREVLAPWLDPLAGCVCRVVVVCTGLRSPMAASLEDG